MEPGSCYNPASEETAHQFLCVLFEANPWTQPSPEGQDHGGHLRGCPPEPQAGTREGSLEAVRPLTKWGRKREALLTSSQGKEKEVGRTRWFEGYPSDTCAAAKQHRLQSLLLRC